ncbi:unnamed protein product [Rotaria magnacalcarata]|uniref:Uncharacterized protein n=1 Tax=Rotaria magnacalcarata TaxID=392030 RepID=A0A815INA2_9BILA|nr:unnamed protein product [Rotaria magnacalcarata]
MISYYFSKLVQNNKAENDQSTISNTESKQVSSRSINSRLKQSGILSRPCSISDRSARHRCCRHASLRFVKNSQTDDSIKLQNSLATSSLDDNKTISESLKSIENSQQEENRLENSTEQIKEEQAQIQRTIYNAKQLPLIPFVIDADYRLLFDLLQQQNDLLANILSLVTNIDEECSIFEQFKI